MTEHTQQAILVTGASTGIGHHCASYLAERGFHVFGTVRKETDAQVLTQASKGKVTPLFMDITDQDSITQAVATLKGQLEPSQILHGIVNNAGIAVGGPMEFLPLSELQDQFHINVFGHVALTQECLPMLRKSRGRIVMISSIAGRNTLPFMGPYSASKHALEAITDAWRVELYSTGIKVALIEPGKIKTPIWDKSLKRAEDTGQLVSDNVFQYYGPALETLKAHILRGANKGIDPVHVSQTISHALTAPNPKTRYLIGKDAKLRVWFNLLPDTLRDKLIADKLGL